MTPGSARACTNSIVHVETEAQCSGVRPSASRAFGSARSASRRSATAEWQFATASESGVMGVFDVGSTAFTSAPAAISPATSASLPSRAAPWRVISSNTAQQALELYYLVDRVAQRFSEA